ncbi:MAG: T9SS type A sorting domain-containing protein, partial [Saprospiraceae bacterium]
APVGSSTALMITNTPVLLEVLQDQNGTTVAINVNTVDGLLEISDPAMNLELAGEIKTWLNPENPNSMEKPVQNVTVTLSGGASNTAVTGVPGTYSFQAPMGVNTVTACSKSTPGNAGVTSGDLLRIVNHIFGDLMPAPYQWVAADVNNSKTITLADYLIIQRLVLGTDQNLLNSPDWKFIPKSYVFPSNSTQMFGPLTNPFPQTINHNPVDMDFLDDDFVAVRMGDVNGNTPVNMTDDANDRYGDNETLYFQLEDRAFQQGEIIRVPFRAADFRARQAYQFTLAFDPAVLELDGIIPGALPELGDENFGMTHLQAGYLTTSWVSRLPVTVPDDEVLFTLQFRTLRGSEALSNILQAGSQVTRAESYTREGATMKVDLRYKLPENGQEIATFALYQNLPNPFRSSTTISFRLPESGRATLRVFTASGQLVKLITGSFADGYNEITLRKDDLGAPGVYWYELETAKQSDRKKMILID